MRSTFQLSFPLPHSTFLYCLSYSALADLFAFLDVYKMWIEKYSVHGRAVSIECVDVGG